MAPAGCVHVCPHIPGCPNVLERQLSLQACKLRMSDRLTTCCTHYAMYTLEQTVTLHTISMLTFAMPEHSPRPLAPLSILTPFPALSILMFVGAKSRTLKCLEDLLSLLMLHLMLPLVLPSKQVLVQPCLLQELIADVLSDMQRTKLRCIWIAVHLMKVRAWIRDRLPSIPQCDAGAVHGAAWCTQTACSEPSEWSMVCVSCAVTRESISKLSLKSMTVVIHQLPHGVMIPPDKSSLTIEHPRVTLSLNMCRCCVLIP